MEDKAAYDSAFPQDIAADPTATPPLVASKGSVGIHFLDDKNYVVYDPRKEAINWTAYDAANPPASQLGVGTLDNNPATSDFIRFGGIKVQLDGVPAKGDEFIIRRNNDQEKRSLLNVVSDLRKALESGDNTTEGAYRVRDSGAVALSNLDTAYSQVDSVRGKIGARLNTIESTSSFIADVSLVNKSVQSDLQDLDYAEALSRYSLQNTVLQATQQSFVKVAQLSLFNYL